jgi:hypothetical protein
MSNSITRGELAAHQTESYYSLLLVKNSHVIAFVYI